MTIINRICMVFVMKGRIEYRANGTMASLIFGYIRARLINKALLPVRRADLTAIDIYIASPSS